MPYFLEDTCVKNRATGETVKCHSARAEAVQHLRALMVNVPDAKASGAKAVFDAPNYRAAPAGETDCDNCIFFSVTAGKGYCHQFNFAADPEFTCDAWDGRLQAAQPPVSVTERNKANQPTPDAALPMAQDVKPARSFAVKSLGGDRIGGYSVYFGDADHADLSEYHDFFQADTDFWLDKIQQRPMLYHHGALHEDIDNARKSLQAAKSDEERATLSQLVEDLEELRINPVIGMWDSAKIDALGVWMEGELDKSRKYRAYVKRMIDEEILAQSSDSSDHLIRRRKMPNGTHKILRWPLFASSLTPTPAEPRLLPVEVLTSAYKSIGVSIPTDLFQQANAAGATAQSAKAIRIARARLEIAGFNDSPNTPQQEKLK